MKKLLLSILLLPGCVVKYGELPQPAVAEVPPVADLRDEEAELLALRAAAASRDVDRRDRIDAALELIRLAQSQDFGAADVEAYLRRVIEVESRARVDTVEGLTGGGELLEEVLAEPEEGPAAPEPDGGDAGDSADTGAGEAPDEVIDEDAVAFAREALAEDDYRAALRALEPLRDDPEVEALWWEAVNGYVHAERERAGQLFLEARDLPLGEERARAIRAVLELLEALADDYPGNAYEDALERNIGLVRRALEEAE